VLHGAPLKHREEKKGDKDEKTLKIFIEESTSPDSHHSLAREKRKIHKCCLKAQTSLQTTKEDRMGGEDPVDVTTERSLRKC